MLANSYKAMEWAGEAGIPWEKRKLNMNAFYYCHVDV
jgi:hypothetical protein